MAEEVLLIALSVALSVAAYMLAPRPPNQPNPLGELPACTEGDPIPVLYGRMLVGGEFVWPANGDQMTLASTKSNSKWFLSWAIVLTCGPLDAIFTIYFADTVIWEGLITRPIDGSPVTLKRTDGLKGAIRVYWGAGVNTGSQTANVSMSVGDILGPGGNPLGANAQPWKGVAYDLPYGGIVSGSFSVVNNINAVHYLEGTDFLVDYANGSITFLTTNPGFPDSTINFTYSLNPTDDLIASSTSDPQVSGGHQLNWKSFGYVIFDHCDVGYAATVPNVKCEVSRGTPQTIPTASWSAVLSWASPARALISIGIDTSHFDGTANYRLKIDAKNYKVSGTAIPGYIDITVKESLDGGSSYPNTIFDGPVQQNQTAVLGTHGILAGFVWSGPLPFQNSQNPTITVTFVEGLGVTTGSVNPVDVLYDILVNDMYGVGIDPSQIDEDSFDVARSTCAQEGRLISLYLNAATPFMQWAQGILFHMDAGIIQREGKLVIKMIRRTYSGSSDSSILALPESDLSDVNVETGQLSQTVNFLQCQFTDSTREFTTAIIPVADIGNAIALGNVRRQTLNLPYFIDYNTALNVATFKAQLLMTAHDTLSCSITRKAAALLEWGDVIKADYPLAGVTQARLWRVMGLKRSPRDPKYVTITAVEEIGFLNASPVSPARGSGGTGGSAAGKPIEDIIYTKIPLELPFALDQTITNLVSALVNRENSQYDQFNLFGGLNAGALSLMTSGGLVTDAGGTLVNSYSAKQFSIDDTAGILIEPRVPSDWVLLTQLANITRQQMQQNLSQKLILAAATATQGVYKMEICSFDTVYLEVPEGPPTGHSTAISGLNGGNPPVTNFPYPMGFRNIVNGSVDVTDGTDSMTEGLDYTISYLSGQIEFLRILTTDEVNNFNIGFQYKTLPRYRILGIVRGLMDTRRQDWVGGTYIFITMTGMIPFSLLKPGSWTASTTAYLQAIPYSSTYQGNSDLFEEQALVIRNRAQCPMSARSVCIDMRSTLHARMLTPGDTPRISWLGANRATGSMAPNQPLFPGAQVAPEAGYRIRVYDNTGALLTTHDWSSGGDGTVTDAYGVVRAKYDYTVPTGSWTSLTFTVNQVLNGNESRDEFGSETLVALRHP